MLFIASKFKIADISCPEVRYLESNLIVMSKIQPWLQQADAVRIHRRPRSAHCSHDQRLAQSSGISTHAYNDYK